MNNQIETKRVDEYHKNGCHFYGKLVVVSYWEAMRNDSRKIRFCGAAS